MIQYGSDGEVHRQYQMAKRELEEQHCKGSEAISKYSAHLKAAYTRMEQTERIKLVIDQVEHLIGKMQMSDDNVLTNIKIAKQHRHNILLISLVVSTTSPERSRGM